jgi:FtsP/CotA-like multicopper oxidase with cupredoxin domain
MKQGSPNVPILSRRRLLASTATAVVGAAAAMKFSGPMAIAAEPDATLLRIASRTIDVNGKAAKVLGLHQPDGTPGILARVGGRFRVRLENHINEPTLIHWHGLLPPYGQDGAPDLPQPLLPSGQVYDYDFPLDTPGTHWMHAHTLQEQRLLAAPLIVSDPAEDGRDEQQVVVLLHDFSFKSPEELLSGLNGGDGAGDMAGHGMVAEGDMTGMSHDVMPGMAMDVNDIAYDAYLANDRTLDDPEVFRVEAGGTVRLRLINGAAATAFWINLGELDGQAIAVDGNPVAAVSGRRFPLGMGQRIDIRIRLPKTDGAWPILVEREGAVERTGFALATKKGQLTRISATSDQPAPVLDLQLEAALRAFVPLAAADVDQRETMALGGDMATYSWTIDGREWEDRRSLSVRAGQRVEVLLRNESMMAHPMHLHGHHFQIVAIDGRAFTGAIRDTVWIPPHRSVTIAFDARNPGEWAFHCHHLYHMASGMMTSIIYAA